MNHTDDEYPLNPALGFLQRLWALQHALEKRSGAMAKRLGVTAQQRLVIRCLGRYPGLPAGRLAEILHLDPGTISAALRRLEAKKLVERRRDPHDRRRSALGLTAKGRHLDRPTPGTVEHAVSELLEARSTTELSTVTSVLDDLTRRLHGQVDIPPPIVRSRPPTRQKPPRK